MLENISKFAEAVATDVSRRAFLARIGRSALTWTAALGGLLALQSLAHASPKAKCCQGGRCRQPGPHCTLVADCVIPNPFNPSRYCEWDCNGNVVYSSCG
jgi:hypothetical protein